MKKGEYESCVFRSSIASEQVEEEMEMKDKYSLLWSYSACFHLSSFCFQYANGVMDEKSQQDGDGGTLTSGGARLCLKNINFKVFDFGFPNLIPFNVLDSFCLYIFVDVILVSVNRLRLCSSPSNGSECVMEMMVLFNGHIPKDI